MKELYKIIETEVEKRVKEEVERILRENEVHGDKYKTITLTEDVDTVLLISDEEEAKRHLIMSLAYSLAEEIVKNGLVTNVTLNSFKKDPYTMVYKDMVTIKGSVTVIDTEYLKELLEEK